LTDAAVRSAPPDGSGEQKPTCLSETSVAQPAAGKGCAGNADTAVWAALHAPTAGAALHKL